MEDPVAVCTSPRLVDNNLFLDVDNFPPLVIATMRANPVR
jgi:hypothetical protein